ncbi:MAG: hypothetical protein ACRDHK_15055, partial [Actinomycetota bacterium]
MFRRRWSPASKVFALLAVATGLGAFRGYAARLEALRPVVGTPTPVVVAAGYIERGTVLTESLVRV